MSPRVVQIKEKPPKWQAQYGKGGIKAYGATREEAAEWIRVERWLYRNHKGSQLHSIVWEMMREVGRWMRSNPPPDSWTVETWARNIDSIEADILSNSDYPTPGQPIEPSPHARS